MRHPSQINLSFGELDVAVFAGSYWHRPEHLRGVKLAPEIDRPCDLACPIVDYGVPSVGAATAALVECAARLAKGESLYVGCWGGLGRTGLFLALMAKASGVADPVQYVRDHYDRHAVETAAQMRFVEEFPIQAAARAWADAAAAANPARLSASRPKP